MNGAHITIDTRGIRRSIMATVVLVAALVTVQKLYAAYVGRHAANRVARLLGEGLTAIAAGRQGDTNA